MKKQITGLVQQGYSILTPTRRLSRYLQNQYAELQLEAGERVWESPDILPWQAWLYRFWDDFAARTNTELLRLSAWQQQSIWMQVVQDSTYARDLLQPLSIARRAVQAWDLSHQWQIPIFPGDIHISQDVRAFQSWAHAYQQRCQAENWIDDVCLLDVLSDRLSAQPAPVIQKIALLGFEDIHPQQQALLKVLSTSGSEVMMIAPEKRKRKLAGAGFIDVHDEIDAVANWVRQLLQTNRQQKIGVVAPGLQKLRSRIQTQFDDVLLAAGILSPSEPTIRPYSISLGQGLNSYPVIAAAFSILTLVEQALAIADIGRLLRSPFIAGAVEEQSRRALLDAVLREYGEPSVSINTLSFIAGHYLEDEQQSKIFLTSLRQWQTAYLALPGTQSAQAWARSFSGLLTTFNWPGERLLNSAEYQTIQAWQDVLTRFVSLDMVHSPLSYRTALAHLRQLAAGFSFQPETAELPVQVMGTVGAAGMYFDHLWLMGLDEEAWPAPTEPNAFIPIALQRQHKLPAASAECQLAQSRRLTDSLLQSSADVVVSYAQNENARALRPSPLIKSYLQNPDSLHIERLPAYRKLVFDSGQFEYKQDDRAPTIATGQPVSGGTGLFKDQAACPFRAFARHRLHARALMQVDIGLNAMARGSLVHDVMQLFWQKVDGHAALMQLSDAGEEASIDASIDAAVLRCRKQRPRTFTERFSLLEKQRLKLLVQEWLLVERQRQSFKVVGREKKHNFVFADIEVHTRIDRIDKLDDGRYIIIDYKTGNVSVNAWFGERPDEPQLPLYAITSEGEIAAIVFAKIRRGESGFIGVAEEEDLLPKVKCFADTSYVEDLHDWQGLLTGWQQTMTQIARDFRQGEAAVKPKNAHSCLYCDLHAFCRINELTNAADSVEVRAGQQHE